jgi:hypothetical protein
MLSANASGNAPEQSSDADSWPLKAGPKALKVGASGFEPPTSSASVRSKDTATVLDLLVSMPEWYLVEKKFGVLKPHYGATPPPPESHFSERKSESGAPKV